jgi:hypothetical protein
MLKNLGSVFSKLEWNGASRKKEYPTISMPTATKKLLGISLGRWNQLNEFKTSLEEQKRYSRVEKVM